MSDETGQRHSIAAGARILSDPIEIAKAEARNGLKQYDFALRLIAQALETDKSFRLRPSMIQALQREALADISEYAGNYRPGSVDISNSQHNPPAAHEVSALVEDMCEFVNDHWDEATAIHLASYLMWRLNWIHPFSDGNGRTSRMVSYVILCIKTGNILPGLPTIPDQIVGEKRPYFRALDDADAAWAQGRLDLTTMEALLSALLARQLTDAYKTAGGLMPPEATS
ncbi:Fic family protein [Ancylobacter sp. FA202]|uniref:Fic family protein n=1 Tax=Ancylobacter sp. FA202 TaxID=1111106 RepID=UPI0005704CB2|nr:Fic family protein [Ancylobacter sp. FA202]